MDCRKATLTELRRMLQVLQAKRRKVASQILTVEQWINAKEIANEAIDPPASNDDQEAYPDEYN